MGLNTPLLANPVLLASDGRGGLEGNFQDLLSLPGFRSDWDSRPVQVGFTGSVCDYGRSAGKQGPPDCAWSMYPDI